MMPRATYCQPQVASFGLTEAQAQEKGYQVKVGRFTFQANGKALGLGDYAGWAKIITRCQVRRDPRRPPDRPGRIRAAARTDPGAAHGTDQPAEIARNVHAHPTLSEVLMEAAHAVEGQAIHM